MEVIECPNCKTLLHGSDLETGDSKLKSSDLISAVRSMTERHPITVAEKQDFLNAYVDADYVAVTASGQIYEYEIKVSRSDYLRDFQKRRHEIYTNARAGKKPNRFWYVMLPGIVRNDLPDYAGLFEFVDGEILEKTKAPLLWRGRHEIRPILQCAAAMKRRGA